MLTIQRNFASESFARPLWFGLWLSVVTLMGCPASQTWTTARSLPKGKIQHTVGVEFLGASVEVCDDDAEVCAQGDGFITAPFPAYVLRYGLTDFMDIGGKFSSSGQLGADLKLQLVRSKFFDFALDPGAYASVGFGNVQVPLLFSVNFTRNLTLTLAPKLSYQTLWVDDADNLAGGLYAGGGVNMQIRINEKIAVTPGFDYQTWLTGGDVLSASYLSIGAGVSFGIPNY